MRATKQLSALVLVGVLTLAAPGIASAHAEGRANCRYATQQNAVFQLVSLGRVQQVFAGVVAGIATSIEQVDRSIDRAVEGAAKQAGALTVAVSRAAGESARLAWTTIGLGPWGATTVHAPR